LPKKLRDRLVAELDKRLDLDIDEILDSPKLRLQLSPAELDKSLLDLYDKISHSPSGDVLRLLSGGGQIGLQNLYMKRQALKKNRRNLMNGGKLDLLPYFIGESVDTDEEDRTASQWVRWALSQNLPRMSTSLQATKKNEESSSLSENAAERKPPTMSFGHHRQAGRASPRLTEWTGLRSPTFLHARTATRTSKFSLLI